MSSNLHLPDSPRSSRWFSAERFLGVLIVALGAFFLLLFLRSAVARLRYPFELEWIESGMLTSTLRIVHGQGLYVAPTLHFVPFLYAPVYLYVCAALTKLTGIGANSYIAMRLVSIVSSLGTAASIYSFIRQETSNRIAASAGAGLYLAAYPMVATFFDIGRVDSLFVFFIMLALLVQRRGYPVLSALIWVVAFQTKQSVLPLAVVVLLSNWPKPKRLAASLLVFLAAAGLSVLLLNSATGGWYVFYVFRVTQALHVLWREAVLYWPNTVLQPFPAAWLLIVAAALFTRVPWRGASALFYLLVSLSLYGGVWFVESHHGASSNATMPIVAWTAVLFGVAVGRLLREAGSPSPEERIRSFALSEIPQRIRVFVLAAAAVQLFALTYNPGAIIPSASAYIAGNALLSELRALPGEVYVIDHGHDAVLAGKQSYAEGEALGAVIDANLGPISSDLRRQLDETFAQRRYTAVVIDDLQPSGTSWKVDPFYPLAISAPALGQRYLTSQPEWFMLPCVASPAVFRTLHGANSLVFNTSCPAAPASY